MIGLGESVYEKDQRPSYKLSRGFFNGFVSNAIFVSISALNTIIASKYLGATGKGDITLVVVTCTQASIFLGLSIEIGLLRALVDRSSCSIEDLIVVALRLTTLLFMGAAALAFLTLSVVMSSGLSDSALLFICASICLQIFAGPLLATLNFQGSVTTASWLTPIAGAVPQIASLLYIQFFDRSATGYLKGFAYGSIVIWLMIVLVIPRRRFDLQLSHVVWGKTSLIPAVRAILQASFHSHLGAILHNLSIRLSPYVVYVFAGASALGTFSVAVSLAESLLIFSQALLSWTLAQASRNPETFTSLRRSLLAILTLSILALGPVVLAAGYFSTFLDSSFANLQHLTLILLPGYLLLSLWRLASYDLTVRGIGRARSLSAAIGLGLGLPLVVGLTSKFGTVGASVGTSTLYSVMALALVLPPGRLFYRLRTHVEH